MFNTKKDVDHHVRMSFSKLSESEKNIRGLTIAKLYFKIGEYASARQYLYCFLSVQEDSAPAHKLLGQCYEKLKKPDKAIAAYQRSLQLDSKQADVITNVCNILLSDDLNINPTKMKNIIDLAETENIQNDAVLNLKLKLVNKDNVEPNQMNDIILKEIITRPTLPSLRIRLLKNFIDQNRVDEAFKYIYELEIKNNENFSNSVDWYNMMARVLSAYKSLPEKTNPRTWEFWLLSIITIEKQIYLNLVSESCVTFSQNSNLTEITNLLFEFDQMLSAASLVILGLCPERELAVQFLSHYSGQLCLHAATILFAREKIFNKNQWIETIKNAIPLLLLAFQCGIPDTQEGWLKHTGDAVARQLVLLWNRQGAFRCSQSGRTILSCIADVKGDVVLETILNICCDKGIIYKSADDLIDQIRKYCSDINWRKSIYRTLFVNDQISKINTSYFVGSKTFLEPNYELPTEANLENYEEIAQWLNPSSLRHLVYLGLGMRNLHDLHCQPFSGLNFSTPNLTNCNSGTLNQLDIDTYLCCTILQTRRIIEMEKYNYEQYNSCTFPIILPFANISSKLCTDDQSEWWECAYKVSCSISFEDFNKLRMTLLHGIEAIRGVGTPKMNLYIALELGNIFSNRSQTCGKPAQKEFLEGRAEALYKHGLHIIKLKARGSSITMNNNYFRYPDINNDLTSKINVIAEKAVAFLAKKYFSSAQYEECIDEFTDLRLPYASYFQAEAYKFLDKSNKTPKKSKKMYIEKAKESLHKTMEYLNDPNIDKNHPLKAIIDQERRRITFSPESVSNGYHDGNKDDYEKNNYKFDEILIKTNDIENSMKTLHESLNLVKEDIVDLKNSDLFSIKSEIIDIQRKLDELLLKKNSLRDEDAQVLENLLDDEEFQNQVLAGATNQMNTSFNSQRGLLHHPIAMQNQTQLPYSLLPQQAGQIPAPNPYNSPIYSTAYPMYMYPFMNLPQTPQGLQLPAKQTPQLNWSQIPQSYSELSPQLIGDARLSTATAAAMQSSFQQPFMGSHQHKGLYDLPPPQQDKLLQNSVADMLAAPPLLKTLYPYNNLPVDKDPPINVVITSSDPLPTHNTVTTQPLLSVTIPPHHIKNNNINVSENINPITSNTSITDNTNISSTDNYQITSSAQSDNILFIPDNETETFTASATLFKSVGATYQEIGAGLLKIYKHNLTNQYRVVMLVDQKAIINHPITTNLKIVKNKPNPNVCTWHATEDNFDGAPKLKYCARFQNYDIKLQFFNEFSNAKNPNKKQITPIKPPAKIELSKTNTPSAIKSFTFATPETQKFDNTLNVSSITTVTNTSSTATFGGFTFKSPIFTTPKPEVPETKKEVEKTPPKSNLFSKFSFGTPKTDDTAKPFANIFNLSSINQTPPISSTLSKEVPLSVADTSTNLNKSAEGDEDDYIPTAQFQPVIPLPSLIDVKTGEEDEIIAFEHRAKLLRYDTELKEWKERGIGPMKVLIHRTDPDKVRLLMRREQVLKLCCNQLLLKDTKFTYLQKLDTAVTWCGIDYSENELKDEVLAVRFKLAETCKNFLAVVTEAQLKMKSTIDNTNKKAQEVKIDKKQPNTKETGFGDEFKAKLGDWNCEACYTKNKKINAVCVACTIPRQNVVPINLKEMKKDITAEKGFGDQFKPKAGAWDCKHCYVNNKVEDIYCIACDSPKDDTIPKKEAKSILPLQNPSSKFSFGIQPNSGFTFGSPPVNAQEAKIDNKQLKQVEWNSSVTFAKDNSTFNVEHISTEEKKETKGFGDQFKPKVGAWDCKHCYVNNKVEDIYCIACVSPKDDTIPKKETKSILPVQNPSSKFTFGIQPNSGFNFVSPTTTATATVTSNIMTTPNISTKFSFGLPSDTSKSISTFEEQPTIIGANLTQITNSSAFNFTSQSDNSKPKDDDKIKPDGFNFEPKKSFDFIFKSKSPGKIKSPTKDNVTTNEEQHNDSEGEIEEEENNTYFTPVIALPEKVEVKTGEENEAILYTHRAKLFRFVDGEWKERGLGDVKILRHNESGKLRVVMRREQVLKICLNHVLTSDIEYKSKDEKSWNFIVNDFSEGVIELMNFCLRFKTNDIALEFKAAIDNALKADADEKPNINISTEKSTDNEVIIPTTVNKAEKKVDDEKKLYLKLIEKLKLPKDFFAYKTKASCPGCRGCNSEDFVFPIVDININKDVKALQDSPLPIAFNDLDFEKLNITSFQNESKDDTLNNLGLTDNNKSLSGGNLFSDKGFSFGTKNIFNKTPTSIFGISSSPLTFGTVTENKNITSKENDNVSEEDNEKAGKNFDNLKTMEQGNNQQQSIFGGKLFNATGILSQPNLSSATFSFATAAKDLEQKSDTTTSISSLTSTSTDPSKFSFPALNPNTSFKPTLTTNIFGGNPLADSGTKSKDSSEKFIIEEKKETKVPDIFKTSTTAPFADFAKSNNKSNVSIFNTSDSVTFGSLAVINATKTETPTDFENLFKTDPNLSFSSLASTATVPSGSIFGDAKPPPSGFFGLTNTQDFRLLNNSASGNEDSVRDSSTADDNYDPHYEPIIALPEEIVVKTGEEDEIKLFGERAKLFRYDSTNKEWKERGVGELKILNHPGNGTYRLLLRREQIHKLVLNHSITVDFVFNPMNTSGNSYCWATMNFSEEHNEGQVENLAARFKNADIAKRFECELNKCLEQIKSRSDLEPEDD